MNILEVAKIYFFRKGKYMISSYNLIGKNVLSLVSGNIIGVIKNIEIKNMRLSRIIA